jgi:hypothetical protein
MKIEDAYFIVTGERPDMTEDYKDRLERYAYEVAKEKLADKQLASDYIDDYLIKVGATQALKDNPAMNDWVTERVMAREDVLRQAELDIANNDADDLEHKRDEANDAAWDTAYGGDK